MGFLSMSGDSNVWPKLRTTDLTSIFQTVPVFGTLKAFDTPGNTPWEKEERVMIMKEASTSVPGDY